MTPEPERDVLDENLRRSLAACRDRMDRSYAEFLGRAEGRDVPFAPARRRGPSPNLLTLAASFLVCAGVLAVILSSGAPSPAPAEPAPPAARAQDAKEKTPKKAPPPSEEQSLQDQIAFQERILEKTADEKDRALVEATIKTLRTDLARAQKGKGVPKENPDKAAENPKKTPPKGEPGDTEKTNLRAYRDALAMKLKNAKDPDDQARIEKLLAEAEQELKRSGEKPKEAAPKETDAKKSAPKAPPPSPKDVEQQVASLNERLIELKAMATSGDLSADERAKAEKEYARVAAELEKLKASAPSEKSPEKKK